jgi:hypothetical protein
MKAVVYFNLGYTIENIRTRLESEFKVRPSVAVVYQWVRKFGKLSTQKSLRSLMQEAFTPSDVIVQRLFKHRQTYLFQVHSLKLREAGEGYPGILSYLDSISSPDFELSIHDYQLRPSILASRLPLSVPLSNHSNAYSVRVAQIALAAAESNFQRHSILQRFFLATDSSTVATEVPVTLTPEETSGIFGISGGGILGHIDFLQVFKKNVLVLDYKPGATKDKKAQAQLVIYAVALSRRTGIHLREIRCAWFDDKDYFSFSALTGYFLIKQNLKGTARLPS